MLVAISALQPFALNVLAPATPSLARNLGASYATVQLTLTLYLVTVAVVQLAVGPLSDRFGRRPCVIVGIILFILGSTLGALATDTPLLLTGRALEGAGAGTAFALARAIIRDTAERDEAASLIGAVTMVMVIAPMLAPLAGGQIDHHLGWRAIFIFMGLAGCLVLALTVFFLPETAPKKDGSISLGNVFSAFPELLRDRAFISYVGALTMSSAAFFAFVAGAPYVVIEAMGGGPDTYGIWFMLNAGAYMIGNFVTSRIARTHGVDRMIRAGTTISVLALTIALFLSFSSSWSPAMLFIPLALNALGNGLTIPSATAAALSVRPADAGAAAGLSGALQLGSGALASICVSALVTIWAPSLTVMMWAMAVIAILSLSISGFIRHDSR
jgi:DHA1 family bicyclomycin/chloramphenicol resistance-like MFS transporter